MAKEKLIIFDTTMRDGEQSPGASMSKDDKLRIARQLERMRVDVIEAGFPAASDGDFESVQAVARTIKDSTVCGLARANEKDIRRCGEAVKVAARPRIHTFIATSPIHMEKKLRMEPSQVIDQAVRAIKWAREYTDNVEFSPEDAGRSDLDFLCRILEQVIKAGAKTINVPDTVGYTLPDQFGRLIKNLRERIPNADQAVWSVHCHNDLGLAVANSLAAVQNGARQVECTINGLGERYRCHADRAGLKTCVWYHRLPCAAEQSHRRCQCVCARVGHPSGRCAETSRNLRNHERGVGGLDHQPAYAGEIVRAQRLQNPPSGNRCRTGIGGGA
jgi:2-isopropylmalate synthase